MIEQTFKEWTEEGTKRFGKDKENWKFVCPSCGQVSCAKDFKQIESLGIRDVTNLSYQECIGRYTNKKGCDWAAYGLFGAMGKGRTVKISESRSVIAFDFYIDPDTIIEGHTQLPKCKDCQYDKNGANEEPCSSCDLQDNFKAKCALKLHRHSKYDIHVGDIVIASSDIMDRNGRRRVKAGRQGRITDVFNGLFSVLFKSNINETHNVPGYKLELKDNPKTIHNMIDEAVEEISNENI